MSKLNKKQLVELKEQLKQLAKEIRTVKDERRTNARAASKYLNDQPRNSYGEYEWRHIDAAYKDVWESEGSLYRLKRDYRHGHIAYCELRGTPRERIERVVAHDNKANEQEIKRIKDFWLAKFVEKEVA